MKNYLAYFREISSIPRGSGNTDAISSYLEKFAHEHNLWVQRDCANNVIIRKPASRGCQEAEALILQGHCDMVCEKKRVPAMIFRRIRWNCRRRESGSLPGIPAWGQMTALR